MSPPIEDVALAHLRQSLRAAADAADTRPMLRVDFAEDLEIPTGLGVDMPSSPYLEYSLIDDDETTRPVAYIDLSGLWPDPNDQVTRPYDRV